jgi:transposase-like protein
MAQEQQKKAQYKCNQCGQTFNSEREFREHQENAHKGQAKGTAPGRSNY